MACRKHIRVLLCLILVGVAPVAATAQEVNASPDGENGNPYGSGVGLAIALTNSGFGLGAYLNRAVRTNSSLVAEMQIGAGKDEREVKFFGYFGNSYIPDKANYFLMLPLQFGLQHRLFAGEIEDNFRPYVQLMAGPTLGWEYPYFRDCNDDGVYSPTVECASGARERTYDAFGALFRGNPIFGAGGTLAVGAHFGFSTKMTQGVRLGYVFNYFFDEIQLLERDVRDGAQQFFGSPTISLTFGRLF